MDVGKGREQDAEALRWVRSGVDLVLSEALVGCRVWDARALGLYEAAMLA